MSLFIEHCTVHFALLHCTAYSELRCSGIHRTLFIVKSLLLVSNLNRGVAVAGAGHQLTLVAHSSLH